MARPSTGTGREIIFPSHGMLLSEDYFSFHFADCFFAFLRRLHSQWLGLALRPIQQPRGPRHRSRTNARVAASSSLVLCVRAPAPRCPASAGSEPACHATSATAAPASSADGASTRRNGAGATAASRRTAARQNCFMSAEMAARRKERAARLRASRWSAEPAVVSGRGTRMTGASAARVSSPPSAREPAWLVNV